MSSNVEERVVEMRFDNKQFEKNADQTMKTLDKLDKSLDLKGSTEGFKDLEKAAKRLDLSAAADAVEAINSKFSLLGTIGDQVLRNLTNRAADFAINWAKSMTFDQVTKGWDKYEAKTKAVQVIMHATGRSIDDVNVSLEELTKYTDDTSYRFDQMVDVISGLASAGVADKDLEQIEKVVEGIANAAASAGISANDAAGVFFNMRQAFQSHALRGQDWMSLESKGFGTEEFRRTAIETAEAMIANGEATDEMAAAFKKAKPTVSNFKDTLHAGWLTDDVLVGVFNKYADRTTEFGHAAYMAAYEATSFTDAVDAAKEAVASGWANIFEQIFGNYEEAKVFWTEVADALINTFSAPTTALAELLTSWHEQGGYVAFINSIRNAWAAVQGVAEAVKETFANIFPEVSVEKLVELTQNFEKMTQRWKQFTSKIDISELEMPADDLMALQEAGEDLTWYWKNIQQAEKHNAQVDENLKPLTETFQGIFAVLNLVRATGTALFKIVIPFTKLLVPIAKLVGVITSALGRMASTIADSILNSEIFNGLIAFLANIAEKAAIAISSFADKVADLIDNFLHIPVVETFVGLLKQAYDTLKKLASPYIEKAAKYIEEFVAAAKKVINEKLDAAFKKISPALVTLGNAALEAASNLVGWLIPAFEQTWRMAETVWGWIKKLGEMISDFWKEHIAPTGVWKYISGKLTELWGKFKEFGTNVINVLKNGGITAALQWIRDKLYEFWWEIRHISLGKAIADAIEAGTIVKVVTALLTVMRVLRFLKSGTSFLSQFPKAIKAYSKGLGVKRIATALLLLAAALYVLAQIPSDKLWKVAGVLGVLALGMLVFIGALQAMNAILEKKKLSGGTKALAKTLAGILTLAAALYLIALAFKHIADVKTENIWSAVGALFAIATVLVVGSVALSAGGKGLLAAAAGLLLIAAAVAALVLAYDKIKEKLKELIPSTEDFWMVMTYLGAAIVGLLAIALVLGLGLKKASNTLWQIGVLVAAIGASLLMISVAIMLLSKATLKDLGKGALILVGLLVAVGILVGLAKLLPDGGLKKIGKLSLMVLSMAGALFVLIGAISVLAKIDDASLKKGLIRLTMVMVLLAGLMAVAAFVKGGNAFLGMALMIGVLVGALIILSKMDFAKIIPAAAAIVAVMTSLMLALIPAAVLSRGSTGPLLAFAGMLLVLAGALWLLANYTEAGNLAGAAIALSVSLIALGIACKKIGKNAKDITWGPILALVTTLAAVVIALMVLAKVPTDKLLPSALAISALLLVLGICAKRIGDGFAGNSFGSSAGAALLMFSIIATIVGAMWALSLIPIKSLIATGAALAILLPIVTLCAMAAAKIKAPNGIGSLKIAGLLLGIVLPIVAGLAIAKRLIPDTSGLVGLAVAMGTIMLAMTAPIAAIAILGKVAGKGGGISMAAEGVMAAAVAIFGLVAIFGILGGLVGLADSYFGDGSVVGVVEKAGEILTAVGVALGNALGSFIGAIGVSITAALPEMGSNISGFFESITPGIEKFNALEIDSAKMDALKTIAEAILILTAAEVLDGIAAFIGGEAVSFSTFAEGVAAMGPALNTFATETADIDSEEVATAAGAILELAKVGQQLGRHGGLLQLAIGETESLDSFAQKLKDAAGPLNDFAAAMKEPNSIARNYKYVQDAATSIGAMVEVANAIHREGGWWGKVAGEIMSMKNFAADLKAAAPDLLDFASNYAGELAGYKQDLLDVAGTMSAFVTVANALKPKEVNFSLGNGENGPWLEYTKTAQGMGEFFEAFSDSMSFNPLTGWETKKGIASNLVEFAQKFGALGNKELTGLDNGLKAVQTLAGIADAFETHKTSIEFLWGLVDVETEHENGLEKFTDILPTVGENLAAFSQKLSGKELDDLSKLGATITDFVNAEVALQDFSGVYVLQDFAYVLADYGDAFRDASVALSGLDYDAMDAAFQWMKDHASDLTDEGVRAVSALYESMITEGALNMLKTGDKIIGDLVDYLKSSTNEDKAKDAGAFFVQGFVDGIKDNISKAESIAWKLSDRTIAAMRRALKIASPSRVMRKLGDYTGEGFVLGLEDWVSASATAGDDLARSVTESAAGVLGYIGDLMNGDLVVDMTIRPVLDLSNMQPGLAAIDTMFSQRQALAAQIDAGDLMHRDEVAELVDVSWKILKEIQNGRDVYLDGKVLAGSMNRRLGRMEGMGV